MDKQLEELSFEELILILEKKTKEVEEGKLDLDNSVKAYEEGMKIGELANKKLDEAERKIVCLNKKEDGSVVEEEIE